MAEPKTFAGLTAWYEPHELALMAELRKGLPQTMNEMVTLHTLKALLDAQVVEAPR